MLRPFPLVSSSFATLARAAFGITAAALGFAAHAGVTEIKTGEDFFNCFRAHVVGELAGPTSLGWEHEPNVMNRGQNYFAGWSPLINSTIHSAVDPGRCIGNEYAGFDAYGPAPVKCTAPDENPATITCTPTISDGPIELEHFCYGDGFARLSEPRAFGIIVNSQMYCFQP